jgi:CSLREA domain-containing protein
MFIFTLGGAWAFLTLAETAVASPTATIIVTTAGDEPDASGGSGNCLTFVGGCTLRAAIETAQAQAGADVINFSSDLTINLGSALPTLTETDLTIDGAGRIIRINGSSSGSNIFQINGRGITVKNLRIYGAPNPWSNIWLQSSALEVEIANNIIGDDNSGAGGCGNSSQSYGGIYIDTANVDPNLVTAWIYGNTLKCHTGSPGDGITIDSSSYVIIGADPSGNATASQQNIIRENDQGIQVSSAENNRIQNNRILNNVTGINVDNSGNISVWANVIENNTNYGVALEGGTAVNYIGCNEIEENATAARNYIRGNGSAGVYVSGASSQVKQIGCNWIGPADNGITAAPNNYGIYITNDAEKSWVVGNTLSGNTLDGLRITASGGDHLIISNTVGLDPSGMVSLPNGQHGIAILDDVGSNRIGLPSSMIANTGNRISSNSNYGVLISNSPFTTFDLNKIGVAADGLTPRGNGLDGIHVVNTTDTTVGTPDFPSTQIIAHNGESGVYLENVQRSQIMTNTSLLNNGSHGAHFFQANGSTVTPQLVSGNGSPGIRVSGNSSINNLLLPQQIFNNGGLPIELGADGLEPNDAGDADTGPNGRLNYPEVTATSDTMVTGTVTLGVYAVAVYEISKDPTLPGGGGIFRGSVFTDGLGNWSIDLATWGLVNRPVAFSAHSGTISDFMTTSSPLSPVIQLGYEVYLPSIINN